MDSFNSTDPNHSIWQTGMTYHGMPYGVYSDSLSYNSNSLPSRTADFTVATDGSLINAGNANIYGYVNTAPGGNAQIAAYGSVGDLNWVYGGTFGIEPGHSADNMNADFLSTQLPNPAINGWQKGWLTIPSPPSGAVINIGGTWTNSAGTWELVGGRHYTNSGSGFTLPSPGGGTATYSSVITNRIQNTNYVYYSVNTLNKSLFIDAPYVVLYCTNGIDYLSPSDYLTLNTNADISIYITGNIENRGTIDNGADYARAFNIYDVAGYTNLAFSFASSFGPALIYAPSSSVSFSGGGASSYEFVGAIVCDNFVVNGHYNFHFDESLGSEFLPIPPWIIQQPTNQIVQVGSNATFNVVVGSATGPYQWYFSRGGAGTPINGATNTSLTITNVQLSDAGSYSVEMFNPYGSIITSPAWLTVYTNAAANLFGAFDAANGQFQLLVQNVSAIGGRMPYTLQASTNLTNWVPILTNGTPFVYTETNSFPQRYYRAVFSP